MHLLPNVQCSDARRVPELRRRTPAAAPARQARMNYRHIYHAGNFADVHKHVALTSILLHLRRKEKPFVFIDTHAGSGLYDLAGDEASKTQEADAGIGKFAGYRAQSRPLSTYLETVHAFGEKKYPGSPMIAAKLLRRHDRFVGIEEQPAEFASVRAALAPFVNARALNGDGYKHLRALLPPPERRGFVLIDPPYEDASETERMAKAFGDAYERFATGIYALWYPLKVSSRIQSLADELKARAPMKLLSLAIDIGSCVGEAHDRLSAAGLLVVNPPFGFDEEMRGASSELLPLLRCGAGAEASVQWLSDRP